MKINEKEARLGPFKKNFLRKGVGCKWPRVLGRSPQSLSSLEEGYEGCIGPSVHAKAIFHYYTRRLGDVT